jgi:DeoR/GlpR family transcriptional regulator of sugar metabolism
MMKLTRPHTLRSLEGSHEDKTFLTVEAIDIPHGATISGDGDESVLVKRMIAAYKRLVLQARRCKIGRVKLHQILARGEVQTLVIDQESSAEFISHLRNRGAEVILALAGHRKSLCP